MFEICTFNYNLIKPNNLMVVRNKVRRAIKQPALRFLSLFHPINVLFMENIIFVPCSHDGGSKPPPYMKFYLAKFQFRPCGRLSCNKNYCHNAPQGAYKILQCKIFTFHFSLFTPTPLAWSTAVKNIIKTQ